MTSKNNLLEIFFISLGFIVLLIGEVNQIERLLLANGIYANQFIIFIGFCFALLISFTIGNHFKVLGCLLFLFPISASLLWSNDPQYGFFKIGNLYLISYVTLVLFIYSIKNSSVQLFIQTLFTLLFFLLVIAILFKLRDGFFDRNKLFFMSGPIVFARLMGIGALLCLIGSLSNFKKILFFVFSMAVVWTGSKGPILALIATVIIYSLLKLNTLHKIFLSLSALLLVYLLYNNMEVLDDFGLSRINIIIDLIVTGNIDIDSSRSISIRLMALGDAVRVSLDNIIFGIGLGGWAAYPNNLGLAYPHNFFLEVFAEGGFFLGIMFCVPFLLYLIKPESSLFFISLFLMLSQQFSGDILDARYWLIFSILTFYYGTPNQTHKPQLKTFLSKNFVRASND